jgi:uncharacterized protein (TIGR03086 family)
MGANQPLEQAIAVAKGVLANVSKEDLDKDTPCKSWKVRDVVNHLVGGHDFFATGMGEEPANYGDVTGADFQGAFDESSASTLAIFSAPGALDKTAKLPFGEMPGAALMGLATSDIFTHSWDLAKATGQSTDLDPALAAALLPQVEASIPDMFRGAEGSGMPFGPKVEAPGGCTAADKVAAFLGRTV